MFNAYKVDPKAAPSVASTSSSLPTLASSSSLPTPTAAKRNGSIRSMFVKEKSPISSPKSQPIGSKSSLKRKLSQAGSMDRFVTKSASQQPATKSNYSKALAQFYQTGSSVYSEPIASTPQDKNDPKPIQKQNSIIGTVLRNASQSSFSDAVQKSTRFDSMESSSSLPTETSPSVSTTATTTATATTKNTGKPTESNSSKPFDCDNLFNDEDDEEYLKFDAAISQSKVVTKFDYIQPVNPVSSTVSPQHATSTITNIGRSSQRTAIDRSSTTSTSSSSSSTAAMPRVSLLSAPSSAESVGRFSNSASSFTATSLSSSSSSIGSSYSSHYSTLDSNVGKTLANSSISQTNKPTQTPLYHGFDSDAAKALRRRKQATKDFKLNKEQKAIIRIVVDQGRSCFYTGAAGTGKSVLLREIITKLVEKHGKDNTVAITAPTALAALSIGGQTLHRFAGTGLAKEDAGPLATKVMKSKKAVMRWSRCKVLIIDEVSMCDGEFLDKLDYIAKAVKKASNLPFGGIQCVFTGDFFQLPPVPDRGKTCKYAFESSVWKTLIQDAYELREVFRQRGDIEFVDMLNSLRKGDLNKPLEDKFKALNREIKYGDGIAPTHLFPLRWQVEKKNQDNLNNLPGPDYVFEATDYNYYERDKLEDGRKILENMPAAKSLILRSEAQVMMLKNLENGLVNGSLGIVKAFLTPLEYQILQDHWMKWDSMKPVVDLITLTREGIYGGSGIKRETSQRQLNALVQALKPREMKCWSEIQPKLNSTIREGLLPLVDFPEHGVILIEKQEFTYEDAAQKKTMVSRTQVPLLLSWALSIHKSQGQTLQRVLVDVSKAFENGQVYVALSRAVSKETLQVIGFRAASVKVDPKVKQFYENLKTVNSEPKPGNQNTPVSRAQPPAPPTPAPRPKFHGSLNQEWNGPHADLNQSTFSDMSSSDNKMLEFASRSNSKSWVSEPNVKPDSIIARLPKIEQADEDPFDIV